MEIKAEHALRRTLLTEYEMEGQWEGWEEWDEDEEEDEDDERILPISK